MLRTFLGFSRARPSLMGGATSGVEGLLCLEPEKFLACDAHYSSKCECERVCTPPGGLEWTCPGLGRLQCAGVLGSSGQA